MSPEQIKNEQTKALQWEVDNRTLLNRGVMLIDGGRHIGVEPRCTYSHEANGGCAVGRLLPKEIAAELSGPVCDINLTVFPENVACMEAEFLTELQRLHDLRDFWDIEGLCCSRFGNSDGIGAAKRIAEKFGLTIDFSKYVRMGKLQEPV